MPALPLRLGLAITRDAAGRITSITYAPGRVVQYAYDIWGLLMASRIGRAVGSFTGKFPFLSRRGPDDCHY